MSYPHDKLYVDEYKDGMADYAFDVYDIGRGGGCVIIGTWPTHSIDNYKDFFNGWVAGVAAYDNPHSNDTCKGSAEFCAGFRFGYHIPANGDAT